MVAALVDSRNEGLHLSDEAKLNLYETIGYLVGMRDVPVAKQVGDWASPGAMLMFYTPRGRCRGCASYDRSCLGRKPVARCCEDRVFPCSPLVYTLGVWTHG